MGAVGQAGAQGRGRLPHPALGVTACPLSRPAGWGEGETCRVEGGENQRRVRGLAVRLAGAGLGLSGTLRRDTHLSEADESGGRGRCPPGLAEGAAAGVRALGRVRRPSCLFTSPQLRPCVTYSKPEFLLC